MVGDPIIHLHGNHAREIKACRWFTRCDWPFSWGCEGRYGDWHHSIWCADGCHHRNCGRYHHYARSSNLADLIASRLRQRNCLRHHYGVRNLGSNYPSQFDPHSALGHFAVISRYFVCRRRHARFITNACLHCLFIYTRIDKTWAYAADSPWGKKQGFR